VNTYYMYLNTAEILRVKSLTKIRNVYTDIKEKNKI